MAQFTTELSTILRLTADRLQQQGVSPSDIDLSTITGVKNVAKASFFTKDKSINGDYREEMMKLKEDYRDLFATMFPLHYFSDEIGQETVTLFKFHLMATIFNNANYINTLFDNLDKNALRQYKVSKTDSTKATATYNEDESTENRSIETDHTGSRTKLMSDEATDSDSGTEARTDAKTGTVTTGTNETASSTLTLGEQDTKSNFGTVTKAGTDTDVLSGRDSKSSSFSDSGSASSLETRNLHNKQKGQYTDTEATTNTESNNSSAKFNGSNVFADTPQGAISNLRTPDVDLTGTGISAIQGSEFNYMTNATLSDNTQVNAGGSTANANTTRIHNGGTYDQTNEGTVNISSSDRKSGTSSESGTENKTDTRTLNITDTTNLTETSSKSGSNTTADTKQGTVTETHNTENAIDVTTSKTFSHEGEGSESETLALKDATTDDSSKSATSKGASNEVANGNGEEYEYSIEFLLEAEKITDKLWKIFDPLFFQITGLFMD